MPRTTKRSSSSPESVCEKAPGPWPFASDVVWLRAPPTGSAILNAAKERSEPEPGRNSCLKWNKGFPVLCVYYAPYIVQIL